MSYFLVLLYRVSVTERPITPSLVLFCGVAPIIYFVDSVHILTRTSPAMVVCFLDVSAQNFFPATCALCLYGYSGAQVRVGMRHITCFQSEICENFLGWSVATSQIKLFASLLLPPSFAETITPNTLIDLTATSTDACIFQSKPTAYN